ncbi:UNVERIFIED_ORG: hypothetical protein FHT06_001531 [Xanthomonas campestris]|uniref:hypothetical protein n=1 Tax=Xanthomonas arboricola TaxID=56448 RepID=UPI0016AD51C9
MKPTNGQRRSAASSYVRLTNRLTLNAMRIDEIKTSVATVLTYCDSLKLKEYTAKLYAIPRVQEAMKVKFSKMEDFSLMQIIEMDAARSLLFYEGIISANSELLNSALFLAAKFESFFLKGDYETALGVLEELQSKSGYSLWLIRHRVLTLAKMGHLEEMQAYCDESKEASKDLFTKFLINCFLLVSSNPLLHTKKIIGSYIKELENAGHSEAADFLRSTFVAHDLRPPNKILSSGLIKGYALLDQIFILRYLLSNNIGVRNIGAHRLKSVGNVDEEHRLLRMIASLFRRAMDGTAIEEMTAKIVEKYEIGNYEEVISLFLEALKERLVGIVGIIGLVAKAQAILGKHNKELSGPVNDILNGLRSLYAMDAPPARAIESIEAIAVQTGHFICGASVRALLYQALPNQYSDYSRAITASSLLASVKGRAPNWIEALSKLGDPLAAHQYETQETKLPAHRQKKVEIREALTRFAAADEVKKLVAEYKRIAPLARDYNEIAASAMLQLQEVDFLIQLCAESLVVNQNSYTSFPLRLTVEHIERVGSKDLDSIIVAHFYARYLDRAKEYVLNEAYEEYFISNDYRRPSEIIEVLEVAKDPRLVILLSDISTTEAMDFLGTFSGSNDVRAERVKILDYLLDRELISPAKHQSEVDEILSQVVVDSAATEISTQKIDVNDAALSRQLLDDITSLLAVYKSASHDKVEEVLNVASVPGYQAAAAVLAGDRNTTALKMWSVVLDSFLYDEKHGLDKNLSAEVRHGFFENLMRSKPDANQLLAELEEDGEYKQSAHWLEINGLLVPETLAKIHRDLSWFTSEFNGAIEEAEEWMKVTTDPSDELRIFNYKTYATIIDSVKEMADRGDAGDLIAHCLGLCWYITEGHLGKMRELLDTTFKEKIDQIFIDLNDRLNVSRGGAAITELMEAAQRARNEVREDISAIARWFRRADISADRRTIDQVIAISIECFERVRHHHLAPVVKFGAGTDMVLINGRNVKPFVIALINLYENCIRHSGFGRNTEIEISSSREGDRWGIAVSNPVTLSVRSVLSNKLSSIKLKLSKGDSHELVRTEGGTGLSKVANQLSLISGRFEVDVSLIEGGFLARIDYVSENTSY